MDKKLIAGAIARTITGTVGGVLIAKGVPPELVAKIVDPTNQALAGAIVVGITGVWSIAQKLLFKRKLLERFGF